MRKMRFFIGFDIGDAESIIEMAISSEDTVHPAIMPGKSSAGQAIPTLYAYDDEGNTVFANQVAQDYDNLKKVEMNFKRRPSDLLSGLTSGRANELLGIPSRELLDEPEFASGPIREFAGKLRTFVNIALTEERFVERARAFTVNCSDCVITVGHPTNWSDLDAHIYEAMLLQSVIGEDTYLDLPVTLQLECESRAAFLYIKNTYSVRLANGEFVGLMDVGSSTIDVSVLTKDSRNCVYDSGSNFLGARSIDYLILEYFIDQVRDQDESDGRLLDNIFAGNEAAFRSLLINCRFAKESLFSNVTADKSKVKNNIFFGDFRVRLTWDTLVNDICAKRPIAPVLVKYCALPKETALTLGDMSWITAFRDFLSKQIDAMANNGITITKLFLTGSASQMSFVRSICKELLPQLKREDSLFDDTNPSNAIANGLARVGLSETRAEAFEKDMERFFQAGGQMDQIIKHRIPDLTSAIADPIADAIQDDIVMPAVRKWKSGGYKTLGDMTRDIEATCRNEKKFNEILADNSAFRDAISTWIEHQVGHDIALELQGIAHKHNVFDFSVDQLNAFKELSITIDSPVNGATGTTIVPAQEIAYALAAVVGIVSWIILPYITVFILALLSVFFETLAVSILVFLASNPLTFAAFAVVSALLGKKVIESYEKNKDKINAWLQEQNFPKAVRNAINLNDLASQMKKDRQELVKKISQELNSSDTTNKLSKGIYNCTKSQVRDRANQIRYEIESR